MCYNIITVKERGNGNESLHCMVHERNQGRCASLGIYGTKEGAEKEIKKIKEECETSAWWNEEEVL